MSHVVLLAKKHSNFTHIPLHVKILIASFCKLAPACP